jgi:DNA polymerase I-like protein with 3'-5' exonuclease and polymerase domains
MVADVPDENCPWDWWTSLGRYFGDATKEKLAHNKKFDCEIVERNGNPTRGFVHDTQVGLHLCDENRFAYDLDSVGSQIFKKAKLDLKPLEKSLGWECIPPSYMGKYAETDTEVTFRLYHHILPRLEKDGLLPKTYPMAMRFGSTIQRVVSNGIPLDVKRAQELSRSALAEMQSIEDRLGWVPSKRTEALRILHGPLEEGCLGLPATRKRRVDGSLGAPVIDSDVLSRLQAKNTDRPDVVQTLEDILRYRTLQKANSTWFYGFQRHVDDEGRIHPGIKQFGTETGRLSCADPNTQQLPRDESIGVKSLFYAPPGYELWEYDFSQIELRIACVRAKDPRMMEAYQEGRDLHHMTAELIGSYGYFPDDKTGRANGRQVGKRGNFLWIYRGSGNRLRQALWGDARMDIPIAQCNAWTDAFHRNYPGFAVTATKAEHLARSRGYIKMWNGRLRRFDHQNPRDAFNALVQGDAGQILAYAMNAIDGHPGLQECQMVNTVHDSIWVMHQTERREEEGALIKECMITKPTKLYKLPFVADEKRLAA